MATTARGHIETAPQRVLPGPRLRRNRPGYRKAAAPRNGRRFDAQPTELNASSEHAARIEREAQAEPEAGWQAEASCEMDMEL